jgi:hypothetical protein
MKLVIDIHEKDYMSIIYRRYVSSGAVDAIMHGTPLNDLKSDIETKCDRINSLTSILLPYTIHREIQELLCEIMDLCKESEES